MKRRAILVAVAVASLLSACAVVPLDGPYARGRYHGGSYYSPGSHARPHASPHQAYRSRDDRWHRRHDRRGW